jgi:SAM-dependent methyltransferase
MDGMQLKFPDAHFDLVISANVIEHVPDPTQFISEAARVLKPTGVCYMETAPLWSGPRGHHIMESMISENCPEEKNYRDDGTIVRDWSHLAFDRDDMQQSISKKLLPSTTNYILKYLYDSKDLNKVGWRIIQNSFLNAFPFVTLTPWTSPSPDMTLLPTDGKDDYLVYGFHALGRKRPKPWLQSKFCYRLRRIGW